MKIGNLNDTQVAIVGAVLIAAIAIGILVFSYFELKKIGPYEELPKFLQKLAKSKGKTQQRALATKIGNKKAEIEKHKEKIAKKDDLKEQINDLQTEWAKLNKMIPPDIDYSALQYKLGTGAEKSRITLNQSTRSDPVYFDANISKITLSLSGMKGSYHDFGDFLYFLYVSLQRFIVLQEFSIESGAPVSVKKDAKKVDHVISMRLVTFIERNE